MLIPYQYYQVLEQVQAFELQTIASNSRPVVTVWSVNVRNPDYSTRCGDDDEDDCNNSKKLWKGMPPPMHISCFVRKRYAHCQDSGSGVLRLSWRVRLERDSQAFSIKIDCSFDTNIELWRKKSMYIFLVWLFVQQLIPIKLI